ncbi:MAG: AAA family ATPase [Ktedonobacteraceae bacterium]
MGHLNLAFLGAPEVHHARRLLTFRTRKAFGLLIYLAVAGGMHSREKLTALFWPESDEPQGRTMLRTTLARLRTALDDVPEHSHLLVERDALGFDFTADVDLDLHILEAAFKHSRVAARAEDLQGDARRALLTQLSTALDRYRGNFLDGFSLGDAPDFDDWVRLQREVWHRRASDLFDHLSQMQTDGGELHTALETTTRWIAHDSFNETAYRRLMQLHFTAGDRNAALRTYETCRATLAKELRAKPMPETEALAERIRAQVLPRRESWPPPRTSSTAALPPMLPDIPLVGRASDYGKLIELFHTVQHNQSQLVILKGEAGIGKTRLASEFLTWTAVHGADVLQGRAFETGGRLPYQPLVEALRSRIEWENAPDDLLSDPWLAELSRVLPELRERYPDLPPSQGDEATARVRLFEAIVRLGQALAERAPLVLFIDDVHRADAASFDVLHYAGQRWMESDTPILLLLNLRTEALVTTKALAKWLADLEHDLHAISLPLESLTFEDILQLVQTVIAEDRRIEGGKLEGFGRWLFAETRGQPFYLIETLKALLERGLLALLPQADGRWAIDFKEAFQGAAWTTHAETRFFAPTSSLLPPGVREVIRSRLNQVNPPAFALLVAGAVLGHGFTFEHLCQVAELKENEGLQALDEVLMSQLLREGTGSGYGVGTYFFAHDKIRDVVYTEAGEARRRIFHRRALEALQRETAPAAELAHHALAARLMEPAFHFSLTAGDGAMRLFAVRDAIGYYEQARQVLADQQSMPSRLTGIPITTLQQLYLQLGRAYELVVEFEQAHATYQVMLAVAQESSIPSMECVALNRLATLAALQSLDMKRATEYLHQAMQVADRSGDAVLLAETAWNLAQLEYFSGNAGAALIHGQRALELARQLNHEELIARSLNVMAYGKLASGHWKEAEDLAEEARVLYRALGNRAMEVDCLCVVANANIDGGRPQAAMHAAHEAHALCQEFENPHGLVGSAVHLAMGSLEIGAYADALAFAELAVNTARAGGMMVLLFISLKIAGKVHQAMLNLPAAHAAHLEAHKLLPAPFTAMIAPQLCADCALAGAWADAYTYATQALNTRDALLHLYTGLTLWYETEAVVRAGETERASEDVRGFGERIGSSRRYRIPYLRALAVLAQHCGESEQAIEHLQEAARLSEEMGLPGELWPIQAALGGLYQQQDDQSQAHRAFACAAEMLLSLADKIEDEQQRTALLSAALVRQVLEHASGGLAHQKCESSE